MNQLSLEEELSKKFPDADLRVLSLEPLKIRYRAKGGSSASITYPGQATLDSAVDVAKRCIEIIEGRRDNRRVDEGS